MEDIKITRKLLDNYKKLKKRFRFWKWSWI